MSPSRSFKRPELTLKYVSIWRSTPLKSAWPSRRNSLTLSWSVQRALISMLVRWPTGFASLRRRGESKWRARAWSSRLGGAGALVAGGEAALDHLRVARHEETEHPEDEPGEHIAGHGCGRRE